MLMKAVHLYTARQRAAVARHQLLHQHVLAVGSGCSISILSFMMLLAVATAVHVTLLRDFTRGVWGISHIRQPWSALKL